MSGRKDTTVGEIRAAAAARETEEYWRIDEIGQNTHRPGRPKDNTSAPAVDPAPAANGLRHTLSDAFRKAGLTTVEGGD